MKQLIYRLLKKINIKISLFFDFIYIFIFRKKINKNDFTIISNNCWGGEIYKKLNLEYKTPTVGLFFFAKDYLKFIENFEINLQSKVSFININDSIHKNELIKLRKKKGYFPIGKINDFEIIFLHYKTDKDAYEKWNRRLKRVNLSRIIFKFNDQNNCSYDDLITFSKLPYENKICFSTKSINITGFYKVKSNKNYIEDDIHFFLRPINMVDYINSLK